MNGSIVWGVDGSPGAQAALQVAAQLWASSDRDSSSSTSRRCPPRDLKLRFSAVRWGIAGNILGAWLLTRPAAGVAGAAVETVTRLPRGEAIALGFAVALAIAAFAAAAGGWPRARSSRASAVPLDAEAEGCLHP